MRSERKKKKTHIFQDEERQMAEDIFGVKFDYGEFEQYGDEEEMEEDYEEDLEVKYVIVAYSCNNITTTLIQISRPFLFWIFLQN